MIRLTVLLLAVTLGVPAGAATPPPEKGGLTETRLVDSAWGDAADQFAFLDHFGPGPRQLGPGPFAVAPDGTIYIVDPLRDHVKVYAPSGEWQRNISIPIGIWNDMTVEGSYLYFFRASRKRLHLGRCDLDGHWTDLPAPDDPTFSAGEGGMTAIGVAALIASESGVLVFDRKTGTSYPLAAPDGSILQTAGQPPAPSVGIELGSGVRIQRLIRSTATESGSTAPAGGIWKLAADGRPEQELVPRAGRIWGVGAGEFLIDHSPASGKGLPRSLQIYSEDGTLRSQAPIVERPLVASADTGPRYRFASGGVYEFWVDREGVHVSRWARAG